MHTRCYNPKDKGFPNYGGRGIKVCDLWKSDFAAFRDWCLSHGYQPGRQLDRIDNNGDYCPSNCRFTNAQVNSRNRRSAKFSLSTVMSVVLDLHTGVPRRAIRERHGLKGDDLYNLKTAIRKMKAAIFTCHKGRVTVALVGSARQSPL